MKKLSICLVVLLLVGIFCSCSKFEIPKAPLVILTQTNETTLIDTNLIGKKDDYPIIIKSIEQGKEKETILSFEETPFAIVVCGNFNADIIVETSKQRNIPVVFINSDITTKTLDSYDKVWNIYAVAKHGGELLGLNAANSLKSGDLADPNQDGMLQCAIVSNGNSSAIGSAIISAADLGVYSNETHINAKTAEEVQTLFTEAYQDIMPPEIIFCDDLELLKGAQNALNSLSKTSVFALLHTSNTQIDTSATPLFACAKYPYEEILSACNVFIENIKNGEAVTNNSDYRLDSHKACVFMYSLN